MKSKTESKLGVKVTYRGETERQMAMAPHYSIKNTALRAITE